MSMNEYIFKDFIGKHLVQRHKAIGLKYAREHGYPEIIGPHSYGILFRDDDNGQLLFQVHFDSRPLYDQRGHNVPGRSIKTITDAYVIGTGNYEAMNAGKHAGEYEEAERIGRRYLELVVEEEK